MAAFDEQLAKTWALTGSQVDSLVLRTGKPWIMVLNHTASTSVYITYGTTVAGTATPAAAADDCLVALPNIPVFIKWRTAAQMVLKVISAGTPTITVQNVDYP